MTRKKEIKKSKGINLLKFICSILIACIYHYKNDFPVGKLFDKNIFLKVISNYGFLLVELFFIISGYLFYVSYNKKIINKKINFNSFIKKRYKRLIPLAALTSIIMFILEYTYFKFFKEYWILKNNNIISLIYQVTGIQYWTNIQDSSLNNVTWYISVLLLCYIVYFFITKYSKKVGNLIYIYSLILFVILMTFSINIPFINYYTLRGLIAFGIGIIVAIIIENNDLKKISNATIPVLIVVFILTCIFKNEIMGYIVFYLDFIIYPCLLINILRFEFLLKRIDIKTTELLSNISFGIYLWNLPIQLLFYIIFKISKIKIDYSNIYVFIIQIIIHIIVGIISYKYIEKNIKEINIKGF